MTVAVAAGPVALTAADLRWLYESGAVTLEQLATLHASLDVISIADVIAALGDGKLGEHIGLDPSLPKVIAGALRTLRRSVPRIPLGRATAIAEPLLSRLRSIPGVSWAEPVGSLRRGQDTVGDIELIGGHLRLVDGVLTEETDQEADTLVEADPPRKLVLTWDSPKAPGRRRRACPRWSRTSAGSPTSSSRPSRR